MLTRMFRTAMVAVIALSFIACASAETIADDPAILQSVKVARACTARAFKRIIDFDFRPQHDYEGNVAIRACAPYWLDAAEVITAAERRAGYDSIPKITWSRIQRAEMWLLMNLPRNDIMNTPDAYVSNPGGILMALWGGPRLQQAPAGK